MSEFEKLEKKPDWKIENGADSFAAPPPTPKQLILGVLHRGAKMMLSAPSKAGKTFIQMHLALCIATGQKWFGKYVRRGRVLYINLELPPWNFHERKVNILATMGCKVADLGNNFHELHLRGEQPTIEQLQSFLDGKVFDLIIIDPQYKLLGDRSENDAKDMAEFFSIVDAISKRAGGAATLIAHHYTKGNASGKEALDRMSGSGAMGRDVDTSVSFTPHETKDCYSVEFVCRCLPPVDAFVVRRAYPIYAIDSTLNPEQLQKAKRAKPKPSTQDVLKFVCGDMKKKDIESAMLKTGFWAINAVQQAVSTAIHSKELVEVSKVRNAGIYRVA